MSPQHPLSAPRPAGVPVTMPEQRLSPEEWRQLREDLEVASRAALEPAQRPSDLELVLADLGRHPEGRYALDIAEATGIRPGYLWPTLLRLQRTGLVASRWGAPAANGLGRHIFWLVER